MTLLDSKFRSKNRSLVKMARQEKIRCYQLETDLYYVARRAKGHGQYLVYLNATKSGLFANCRTIRGAACPSFGACVHIAKVNESLRAELNKRERKSDGVQAA